MGHKSFMREINSRTKINYMSSEIDQFNLKVEGSIDEQPHLDNQENDKMTKRTYNQVDLELRKRLLDAIQTRNLSIKTASDELGINYSTAKNIVRIYRREKRMNKLPKRVNKALEDVLKQWKKPPKKISRFIAKKCPLLKDGQEGLLYVDNNPNHQRIKIDDNRERTPLPSIQVKTGLIESIFDFKPYTVMIAKNFSVGKFSQSSCGSKGTLYGSICY